MTRKYELFFDSLRNFDINANNHYYLSFSLPQPLRNVSSISLKQISYPTNGICNFAGDTNNFNFTLGENYGSIHTTKTIEYRTNILEVLTDMNFFSSVVNESNVVFDINEYGKVVVLLLDNASSFIVYGALDYYNQNYGDGSANYVEPAYTDFGESVYDFIPNNSMPLNKMLGFISNKTYKTNALTAYTVVHNGSRSTRTGFVGDSPANICFDSFFYMYFENVNNSSNSADQLNSSFKIVNPYCGQSSRPLYINQNENTSFKQHIQPTISVPISKLNVYFYNRFGLNMIQESFPTDISFVLQIEGD